MIDLINDLKDSQYPITICTYGNFQYRYPFIVDITLNFSPVGVDP